MRLQTISKRVHFLTKTTSSHRSAEENAPGRRVCAAHRNVSVQTDPKRATSAFYGGFFYGSRERREVVGAGASVWFRTRTKSKRTRTNRTKNFNGGTRQSSRTSFCITDIASAFINKPAFRVRTIYYRFVAKGTQL